jgi:hypothetical protein
MFQVLGDETLEISVSVGNDRPVRDDYGHTFTWMAAAETYGVADGWGAGEYDPVSGSCAGVGQGPGDHQWVLGSYSEWAASLGYWHDWDWYVDFNVCK